MRGIISLYSYIARSFFLLASSDASCVRIMQRHATEFGLSVIGDCHVCLQGLLSELVTNCDGALKAEVTQMAAYYEHRLQLGNKAIFHLEAFVAKFMSIYKRFLEEGLADMMF